ncbi:SGNH/GDSL hydrolase family protein [Clostridium oryzae]|uniref:GDSL-like lipase/acylhydrolase n=1 Tax=Clostridium oryzae TaxID=1450648 RepID=A0A1V4IUS1_9CLOT|nr:SGNH/GDSL hydrolase family protein [Clostridium oryzae]OPJ63535.1 GDSL-like lipase/acylhydrolase [Clostridium oryzae]
MEKKLKDLFSEYASGTILSTANNCIMDFKEVQTFTYRTYIKPREYGDFVWKTWCSNTVDSTWDDGAVSRANLPGGKWKILNAYLADGGSSADGTIVADSSVPITYNNSRSKDVEQAETFESDDVRINIPEGHYLAFTWTITNKTIGQVLPYNCEGNLASAYIAKGNLADQDSNDLFEACENMLVLPSLILYKKAVTKNIVFFGDSITQGVRTQKDKYEYWVSKIADGLGVEYGIWNLGCGWSRAKDAAQDGKWLYKAKHCDEIVICLGVNDIGTLNRNADQIINDLTIIINRVKENNSLCKVILFTVPTFDFKGQQEIAWRRVNEYILKGKFKNVDRIFDITEILSQDKPNDNLEKVEYHSNVDDPHPNGLAGTRISEKFLKWY